MIFGNMRIFPSSAWKISSKVTIGSVRIQFSEPYQQTGSTHISEGSLCLNNNNNSFYNGICIQCTCISVHSVKYYNVYETRERRYEKKTTD